MKKYRKAVFIVAYKIKPLKYLLLKRKLHWKGWEFPKGGIERKEDLIKTVKRELFEETGLVPVKIINHKTSGKFPYDTATRKERNFYGQTYKLFSAEVKDNRVEIDRTEHSSYKWLEFKKAIKKLTWKNQKKSLKIVNNYLNK